MTGKRLFVLVMLLVGLVVAAPRRPVPVDAEGSQAASVFLPLVKTPFKNDIFGVAMYGSTAKNSKYYNSLVGTTARWIRVEANWAYVEPSNTTPENFNWTHIDAELAAARADHGRYKLIVTVLNAPGWAASTPHGRLNATGITEFPEFVQALVERYDGDGIDDAPGSPVVRYWEFYNEPDHNGNWGAYPTEYAAMLKSVYPVIKAADPHAQVVFGGVAHDWFEDQLGPFVRSFLDDVFSADGGDQFDIMNFHIYAAFYENWTTRGVGLREKAIAIRQLMNNHGLSGRPMMVTEAGWCSQDCNDPESRVKSQQNQARYVVALLTQSLAADLDAMVWWLLYDLTPAQAGHLWAFGLVTDQNPPQPKLSYHAYRTAVAKLGPAQYERMFSNAETGNNQVEFYQFFDEQCGCKRYVGWLNPLETSATWTVSVPHSQIRAYEIVNGALIATWNDADDGVIDGKTRVTVTGAPRYFEGN
jgi:hypothetical protein